MNAKIKAYKRLNGKFPAQFKYLFYSGVRISRDDFNRLDVKFGIKYK